MVSAGSDTLMLMRKMQVTSNYLQMYFTFYIHILSFYDTEFAMRPRRFLYQRGATSSAWGVDKTTSVPHSLLVMYDRLDHACVFVFLMEPLGQPSSP